MNGPSRVDSGGVAQTLRNGGMQAVVLPVSGSVEADREMTNSGEMSSLSGWGGGACCCLTCAGWLGSPTSGPDSPPRCWIGPSAEAVSCPWCFSSGSRPLARVAGLAIASSLTFDPPLTPSGWAWPWPSLCWDYKKKVFFFLVVKKHHKLLILQLLLLLFFYLFLKQKCQLGHFSKLLGCKSSIHLRKSPQKAFGTRRLWTPWKWPHTVNSTSQLSDVPAGSARGRRFTAAADSFNSGQFQCK